MVDQKQEVVKIVFGDPYPGSVRVMLGQKEVPNIVSVKVETTKPGELPVVDIKMLAPVLAVEDHTDGGVGDMEEVPLKLDTPKVSDAKPPASGLKNNLKPSKK